MTAVAPAPTAAAALDPRPSRWLGAPAPGGLALPAAAPNASQLYAPRGVWLDEARVVAVDSGNHRVLLWRGLPDADHCDADVVLGQPDRTTEGPHAGGRGVRGGLHLPTGVCVADGRLIVADAWHHRLLVWDGVPDRDDAPPAWAIGQRTLDDDLPNAGRGAGAAHATGLYWPYGVAWCDGWLWVADTGNRRVLGWHGVPAPGRAPDVVLGQPDAASNAERRGGATTADGFRWPHAIATTTDADGAPQLLVADAGLHRVLGWSPAPRGDAPATLVLGQRDLGSAVETPHVAQGPRALRFPYGLACADRVTCVADTANNRVLVWDAPLPADGAAVPASHVLGQPDFDAAGENRWTAVRHDTLCWPYGLACRAFPDGAIRLAVADSGNNRVVLWTLRDSRPPTPA